MDKMYIVKNSDHDGYNQKFNELPSAVMHINDLLEKWREDGYLKEGDEIYECTLVGTVQSKLVLKTEQ